MDTKKIKIARKILIISIILLLFLLVIVEIMNNPLLFTKEDTSVLVFYHWWTAAGEQAALNALINVFSEQYPNVTIVPTSIPGGGGYELLKIIQPLVLARESPDAFQMHAGYETKLYYDAGILDSVDNIWQSENLEKVTPKVIQAMCQFEGHYYSVPVDIHRSNVVWYNKKILDKNGIDPSKLVTWDEFFNACDKLKANGVKYPIQMGRDWTAAHVFEQIVASEGIEFYQDWINGNVTSADDPRLLDALTIFKKYLSYVNPDHASIEWNDITKRIINGEGAFNIMGDWANGEFKAVNMVYKKDYGTFIVPETGNMYGLVIDTFQRPKYMKHPTNSERWLQVVASKEGQDAFNPLKGSISVRTDTNLSKYDLYQRTAILDFSKAKSLFPSVVHGSGAPNSFRVKLLDIIEEFTENLDVNKTAQTMTDYTKSISREYTIIWQLA